MYQFVTEYCRTCHECQTRSSYRNKIPIEPTYVRTILREFGADVVHMPLGKGGLKYVVDMRDKFSGWVKAKAFRKVSSSAVAAFIFDVMCRFGCIPKITVDNGSEFKGAVKLLAEQYNIPLIPISLYNPSANGIVEQGHGVYIHSVEVMVYQYDIHFGYGCWMTSIPTLTHIFIFYWFTSGIL